MHNKLYSHLNNSFYHDLYNEQTMVQEFTMHEELQKNKHFWCNVTFFSPLPLAQPLLLNFSFRFCIFSNPLRFFQILVFEFLN